MGAGGKTYIILCILFFISSEALVVSNALKPSQTQHVVQHVIGSRTCGRTCPSDPVHAPRTGCRPGKPGCGRPPAP
ncbi:unnamed protein product, partial [Vitis vinifera]|uniref:Uncharacterized protein n=1 Tax=Vitis vinifera TaxID=29760 RepID=D7T9C5_VITVI